MLDLLYEKHNFANYNIIAGADEVGRGCIAGPVVACCLVLKKDIPTTLLSQIEDSKKLAPKKRQQISDALKEHAFYSIAEVEVKVIDSINILQASLLAIRNAYTNLSKIIQPDILLIDGNQKAGVACGEKTVVKGDQTCVSIAAASILAKVHRDNLMLNLATNYPQYLWHKNAGYGTKEHLNALLSHGICEHHRKSFAPVKAYL